MNKLRMPRWILWLTLNLLLFLVIMTLLRAALVIGFGVPNGEKANLADAFGMGLRFDLRTVSILSLVLFLLALIPGLHPLEKKWGQRISLFLILVFILILSFFYVTDFANYAYLKQRMNASLLNYLDDAKISMKMVWQTYPVIWVILGILVVVFILFAAVKAIYNFTLGRKKTATRASKWIWSVALFLVLAFGIFGRVGQYPLRWSDAFALKSDYAANISLNPFQSFFSSLSFRHSSYDEKKVREGFPIIADYLGLNKDSLQFIREIKNDSTATQQPNVVLVICESFSAYKSSAFGNPLNTTPFFDSLSREGLLFTNCFTPTYGTAKGVWATLTGVPDVSLYKTASRNPSAVDQHTIINDFKGYEKFYFLGGSTSWANIRGLLTNNINGLHLYEEGDYKAAKIDVWGISDKNLFLEANKVLAQQQKPFFAVIQTADNHRPYTIPSEDLTQFKKRNTSSDSLKRFGFESNDELNAFRYADFSYRTFFEAAKQSKYFNNTIFLFIGDHGIRGDASGVLPQAFTAQGLTSEHVPLLIYAPGKHLKGVNTAVASQIDVLPTLAGIAGIPYTNTSLGRDLLNTGDSTKNTAFIFEAETKRIGVVKNGIFYSQTIDAPKTGSWVQLSTNQPPAIADSVKDHYRQTTEAFYNVSRYLLLNNKKRN